VLALRLETMTGPSEPAAGTEAPFVSFDDFRRGLPHGRFHVVVDPVLARSFVAARMNVLPAAIALIGCGIGVAFAGYPWWGALLVAAGIVLRRVVRWQAPKIALHLAASHEATYLDATSSGVMEVRRVSGPA
jgi:hypothetical protein